MKLLADEPDGRGLKAVRRRWFRQPRPEHKQRWPSWRRLEVGSR